MESYFDSLIQEGQDYISEGDAKNLPFNGPVREVVPQETPTVWEAAFRRENIVGSFFAEGMQDNQRRHAVEGFSIFQNLHLLGDRYQDQAWRFVDAQSPQEVDYLKGKLERENLDLQVLANAGAGGIVASMIAGVVSPDVLIPVAGVANKVRKIGTIGAIGAGSLEAGAGAVASEILLQANQETRSATETALNVSGAMALGAIVGTGVHMYSASQKKFLQRMDEDITKFQTRFEAELRVDKSGEKVIPTTAEEMAGVLSRATGTDAKMWAPGTVRGFMIDKLLLTNPHGRLARSDDPFVRVLAGSLVSNGMIKTDKKGFFVAPGNIERALNSRTKALQASVMHSEHLYRDYARAGGGMRDHEIFNSVSVALRNKGQARGLEGADKALVESIAKEYQTHLDTMLEDGIKYGLFSKTQTQDASYFARIWDYERVALDPEGFKQWANSTLFDGNAKQETLDALFNDMRLNTGQSSRWHVSREPGSKFTKERHFDIPTHLIPEQYLMTDARLVLDTLAHKLLPDIELVKLHTPHNTNSFIDFFKHVAKQKKQILEDRDWDSLYLLRREMTEAKASAIARSGLFVDDMKMAKSLERIVPERRALHSELSGLRYLEDSTDKAIIEILERAELRTIDSLKKNEESIKLMLHSRIPLEAMNAKDLARYLVVKSKIRSINVKAEDIVKRLNTRHERRGLGAEYQAKFLPEVQGRDLAKHLDEAESNFNNFRERMSLDALDFSHYKAHMKRNTSLKMAEAQAANKGLKAIKKIEKQGEADLRDLDQLLKEVRNEDASVADPSSMWVRTGRAMRKLNHVTKMGGVLLSSIPDMANTVTTSGALSTAQTVRKAFKTGFFKSISRKEAGRMAKAAEYMSSAKLNAFSDLPANVSGGSALERGLDWTVDKFNTFSFMRWWNSMTKGFAGFSISNRLLLDVDLLARGKLAEGRTALLSAAGIDKRAAKKIHKAWRSIDGHVDRDGYRLAQSEQWTDLEAKNLFESAVFSEIDRSTVTVGIGDRPSIMTTEGGKLIGQFKSFGFAAQNRVLIPGLQRWDRDVLAGFTAATTMGAMVYGLKGIASGKELSDDPRVWAQEAVDRSGSLGIIMELNNIIERASGNAIGISPMIGGPGASRYAMRNGVDALLGPTMGLGKDLHSLSQSAASGDISESDINRAKRIIPFQNIFYLRRLFDLAAKQTSNAFLE